LVEYAVKLHIVEAVVGRVGITVRLPKSWDLEKFRMNATVMQQVKQGLETELH